MDDRRSRFAKDFARLRPRVTHAQAEAALQPFFREMRERELKDPYFAVPAWRAARVDPLSALREE